MTDIIGNILQIITIISSGLGVIGFILLWSVEFNFTTKLQQRGNSKIVPYALFYLGVASTVLTFSLLVYSFIISDFSLQNIFLNSSTIKPLIYKIAGSWSNHEGSILLWFCLLQLVSGWYVFLLKDELDKKLAIFILSILQLLLSTFIYFTSNSFIGFSFIPKEGIGLNPMLQDIALSIHPPILYLGYVAYVVPFTSSCVMLLRGENQRQLILLKKFSSIGILFTTCGIALGSWWAYKELGWGGFWSFDPVENISLFPWLSGIALFHSSLYNINIKPLRGWIITLSIITFISVIFSTFLVRSGFITSIHSFAESPKRGLYLLLIFLIISIGSIYLLASREQITITEQKSLIHSKSLSLSNKIIEYIHKTPLQILGIILGNICFLISLVILICATIYPVLHSLYYDNTIIIGKDFFIKNFIIFTIPILFISGFFASKNSIIINFIALLISLAICYIILLKVKYDFIIAGVITASIFLMLHNLYYLINKTNFFQIRLKARYAGMILGHFGIALIAFSITLNSVTHKEINFTAKLGERKTFRDYTITCQNIKFASGVNYYRQIVELWLEDNKHNITILKPEKRWYTIEKTFSQESDIYSYLTYDLYAVLGDTDENSVYATIYIQPMMSFVWLGIIMISGGFFISLIRKDRKS